MKKVKIYSRQLLGLGLFLGSSFLINAQSDLAMVDLNNTSNARSGYTIASTYNATHTNEAISKISAHISETVVFPEHLKDLQIEEKVVVELKINDRGQIIDSQIISKTSKSLNKAVLKSLSTFNQLVKTESAYQGVNTVHIPVQFTK